MTYIIDLSYETYLKKLNKVNLLKNIILNKKNIVNSNNNLYSGHLILKQYPNKIIIT